MKIGLIELKYVACNFFLEYSSNRATNLLVDGQWPESKNDVGAARNDAPPRLWAQVRHSSIGARVPGRWSDRPRGSGFGLLSWWHGTPLRNSILSSESAETKRMGYTTKHSSSWTQRINSQHR